MLLNLCIKDYALIDDLSISFGPGLNVLTGETGAGKSIIIDAINLIIGERAYTDFIRTGKLNASVEAVFDYEDALVEDILKDYGIEPEDNTLIIRREISAQGRSFSRLNGKMVPASALKKIGKLLIDIHGQHEHQSLLDSKNHRRILDLLGHEDISESKNNVSMLYKKYCKVQRDIDDLESKYADFCRQQDRLRYEVDELEKAQMKPKEDLLLEEDKKILENAEQIFKTLEYAYNVLYQGYETPSIIDNLNKVIDNFEGIIDFYKPIESICESLKNILYELEDTSSTVRNLRDAIDFDMGKLDKINARLELLHRLKSKYNKSITELLKYKNEVVAELEKAFNINEGISVLRTKLTNIELNLSKSAVELTKKRKKWANNLEKSISKELEDLGMKNVKFEVDIRTKDDPDGIEVEGKRFI